MSTHFYHFVQPIKVGTAMHLYVCLMTHDIIVLIETPVMWFLKDLESVKLSLFVQLTENL